jgi:hypothetical protein
MALCVLRWLTHQQINAFVQTDLRLPANNVNFPVDSLTLMQPCLNSHSTCECRFYLYLFLEAKMVFFIGAKMANYLNLVVILERCTKLYYGQSCVHFSQPHISF